MIFVYSRVSYLTYVSLQISCRVPLNNFFKIFFLFKIEGFDTIIPVQKNCIKNII